MEEFQFAHLMAYLQKLYKNWIKKKEWKKIYEYSKSNLAEV